MFFLSVIAATCPWDNSKCTSDGDDCYVRPFEPMTCADGLLPIQKRSSTQTYSCCAPDDLTSCNASKCNALDYYGNPKGCVVSQSRTDPFTCSDGYVPVLPTYDTSTGYTCCDQGFTGQQTLIKPANTWAAVVDGMLSGSAGDSSTFVNFLSPEACCALPGETVTCGDGYIVVRVGGTCESTGARYQCQRPATGTFAGSQCMSDAGSNRMVASMLTYFTGKHAQSASHFAVCLPDASYTIEDIENIVVVNDTSKQVRIPSLTPKSFTDPFPGLSDGRACVFVFPPPDSEVYTWPQDSPRMVQWATFNLSSDTKLQLKLMRDNVYVGGLTAGRRAVSDVMNTGLKMVQIPASVAVGHGYHLRLCTEDPLRCWKSGTFSVIPRIASQATAVDHRQLLPGPSILPGSQPYTVFMAGVKTLAAGLLGVPSHRIEAYDLVAVTGRRSAGVQVHLRIRADDTEKDVRPLSDLLLSLQSNETQMAFVSLMPYYVPADTSCHGVCGLKDSWTISTSGTGLCQAGSYKNSGACTQCPRGKFKEQVGDQACSNCAVGKYSAGTGRTCLACPANSDAPAGSGAVSDCICNAGFTGFASVMCQGCAPGTYKAEAGDAVCMECGAGKYSVAVAATGESACSACPANSNSPPGSGASSDCSCDVGYTGSDDGMCTSCVAGKYKNVPGPGACSDCSSGKYSPLQGVPTCMSCPMKTDSPPGSSAASDCLCKAGYFKDLESCKQCPQGKFKEQLGDEACSSCEAGKYSTQVGQVSASACLLCKAGKYSETAGRGDECQLCAASKYSSQQGADNAGSCQDCPLNTTAAASSDESADCTDVCAPGWTGSPGDCTVCAAGTYKAENGSASCSSCPTNSNSLQEGQSSCTCNAGYERGADGMCASCGQGKYKESQGDGPCTSCDAGSYSLDVGATSQSMCIPCVEGKYSVRVDRSCADCPANSVSPAASVTLSDCECASGYTGSNGTCKACEEGTYKVYPGDDACIECARGKYSAATAQISERTCSTCPANSDSPAGSGAVSDCICNAGFTGYFAARDAFASVCTPCAIGKYKAVSGSTGCEACEEGTTSPAGSIGMQECLKPDASSTSDSEAPASTGTSDDVTSPSPTPSPASVLVFVVKMAVSMPLTKESFTADKQTQFKVAMANAAGVSAADVVIVKVENINRARFRRLLVRCVYTLARNVKFWCLKVYVTFQRICRRKAFE